MSTDFFYREVRPCSALARYVDCYRIMRLRRLSEPAITSRVLPTGATDVFFSLRDPVGPPVLPAGSIGSTGSTVFQSYVGGPMDQAFVTKLGGLIDVVGVRFKPGGATPFLREPLHRLVGLHIDLEAIVGSDAAEVVADLGATANDTECISFLERRLVRCLERREHRVDPLPDPDVALAVDLVAQAGGNLSIRSLEEATGSSGRRLQRKFGEHVGLTPKGYARVVRLRRAVALLDRRPEANLLELVHNGGFYDQAHLIREFKDGVGPTPGAYARARQSRAQSRNDGFIQFNAPEY